VAGPGGARRRRHGRDARCAPFRVKERLPWFDGALLDNIVDYLTYVFAPVVLLLQTGYLPDGVLARSWPRCRCRLELPVLPGGRQDRRPLLPRLPELLERRRLLRHRARPRPGGDLDRRGGLRGRSVLVPIGYLYPSRMTVLRTPTLAFSALWLVLYGVVVAQLPSPSPLVVGLSLVYIAYYCG
jgi:phosphatidylcholine synthase